jgi:hypothetical protein
VYRIDTLHEYDRCVAAGLANLRHDRSRASAGQNDVGRERQQLPRVTADARAITRGPAGVDLQVVADGPPSLLQPLHESDEAELCFRVVCRRAHEDADASHPVGLLRTGGERPRRRRAAEERDEIAASHAAPKGFVIGSIAA